MIPSEILTLLRQFSSSSSSSSTLILKTYLPQLMLSNDYKTNPTGQSLVKIQRELLSSPQTINNDNNNDNNNNTIIFNNTNPPYIPSQFMSILTQLFQPTHIVSDLPSLDREDDGGKVLSHKLHFLSLYPTTPTLLNKNDPQQPLKLFEELENCYKHQEGDDNSTITPPSIPQRTNTELCWFPLPSQQSSSQQSSSSLPLSSLVLIDLRVAPIDSDASPSIPIIYPLLSCSIA